MASYDAGEGRDTVMGGLQPATRSDVERLERAMSELLTTVRDMASRHDTMDRRIQQIEALVTRLAAQAPAVQAPAAAGPQRAARRTKRVAAR